MRDCACSPFLCHPRFAVFFLLSFNFSFSPGTCSLQVRVVNLPSLPWMRSWNVLCCQNYQKSPLQLTFGNPSCSAGRKGRGGKARSLQSLLLGCPPTRLRKRRRGGEGSRIASVLATEWTERWRDQRRRRVEGGTCPLLWLNHRGETPLLVRWLKQLERTQQMRLFSPFFQTENTYPAHSFPSDTLPPAQGKTDKRHKICHFSRRLLSKVP